MAPSAVPPIELRSADLEAHIAVDGAELVGLRYRGRELLWHGGPAFWDRTSPILFPVVGRTHRDSIRVGDRVHEMPMHGFARECSFEVAGASASSCRLVLEDSERTLVHYPYAFRLSLTYALDGRRLTVDAELANRGAGPLPASFGFHPGFRWPLEPGRAKTDYAIRFPDDTDALVAMRPHDGWLDRARTQTPLVGSALRLTDDVFRTGSIVFLSLASRWVEYGAPNAPLALRIAFAGLPQLAIWSRPPGDFVCIEPWHGHPEPSDFSGRFEDKPGLAVIPAGAAQAFGMTIEVVDQGDPR
ncbi:MAG: aldose 1-epimerase family protein [Proteobacteria bacterium]|nr:aldose 1-epimerase family protein [Pseudomonadota bacterium]